MDPLASIRDIAWLYVAAPALCAAGLWATVRLGAPQLTRLGAAFRALRGDTADAKGDVSPAASAVLASVGTFGAAAAVGAATAVALGGAGALAWTWVFALVLAPLRVVETLLARTDAPGARGGGATGSLAGRLMRDRSAGVRAVGATLAVVGVAAGLLFVGGVHGTALVESARALVPTGALALGLGTAAVAVALGVAGSRRVGSIMGWLALFALAVLVVALFAAALSEPARALRAVARAFGEIFRGAPPADTFTGALAGELARASVVNVLAPLGAFTGIAGGVGASSRATTKRQASIALLEPFAWALATSVLVMAFVATGAFFQTRSTSRTLDEITVYKTQFETVSQRLEPERLYDGYIRVKGGAMVDMPVVLGTERGMIAAPHFEYYGRPADLAIHLEKGRVLRLMRPVNRALSEIPTTQARQVTITGEMLPRSAALVSAAAAHAPGGAPIANAVLAALLVLGALAGAIWGQSLARSVPRGWPAVIAPIVAALPGVGIALAASGMFWWLASAGAIAGAALATVAALGLALRTSEAAKLGS